MAKLYLKGRQDPILLNNKEAADLKDKWLKGELPNKVDLGEYVFEAKDIRSIDGVLKLDQTISKYDLKIPGHRKIILEYEKEYRAWKEKNPKKKVDYWWEDVGAMKITNKELGWYMVLNPRLMNEHQAKWSAFQIIRWEREREERRKPENIKPLFKKNELQEKKQGDTQAKN